MDIYSSIVDFRDSILESMLWYAIEEAYDKQWTTDDDIERVKSSADQ